MRDLNSVSRCILLNYVAANNAHEVCKVSVDPCLQQTDAFLHLLVASLFFPTLSALVLAMLGNSFTFWKEKGYLFCSISN